VVEPEPNIAEVNVYLSRRDFDADARVSRDENVFMCSRTTATAVSATLLRISVNLWLVCIMLDRLVRKNEKKKKTHQPQNSLGRIKRPHLEVRVGKGLELCINKRLEEL
jgi:hypothetical protein